MKCNDKNIANLLPDYFSGHLDYRSRKQVEAHLEDCPDCRKSLKAMQLLSGQSVSGSTKTPEHIDPQTLAAFYQDPSELSSEDRAFVEKHLSSCEQCAYDLDFMRDMESELRASVKSQTEQPSLLARIFQTIPVVVRKPAFAYFLVALMIYPASKYLIDSEHRGSETDVVTLTDVNRSSGTNPIVYRQRFEHTVRLNIPQYHSLSSFDYSIRLKHAGSNSALSPESITDFSKTGQIGLILKVANLPDGSYDLEVIEVDLNNPADTTTGVYPFDLITR